MFLEGDCSVMPSMIKLFAFIISGCIAIYSIMGVICYFALSDLRADGAFESTENHIFWRQKTLNITAQVTGKEVYDNCCQKVYFYAKSDGGTKGHPFSFSVIFNNAEIKTFEQSGMFFQEGDECTFSNIVYFSPYGENLSRSEIVTVNNLLDISEKQFNYKN